MFSIRKPSSHALRRFLARQSRENFTYPEVGATANDVHLGNFRLPPSYTVDHNRIELGKGEAVFRRAEDALRRWQQFDLGWLEAFPSDTPICTGETVLVIARAGGLWWANAARIVYTIDDKTAQLWRVGFAYGTLPGHVESGEERFLIEWDRTADKVWFDIVAFSRPRHFLVRMNRRRARVMQQRFAVDSTAAMQRAVRPEG